eukprot:11614335-Alexandrium_andersonii.AAC.1
MLPGHALVADDTFLEDGRTLADLLPAGSDPFIIACPDPIAALILRGRWREILLQSSWLPSRPSCFPFGEWPDH